MLSTMIKKLRKRDFEVAAWSRRTQPSGPMCLWQCFFIRSLPLHIIAKYFDRGQRCWWTSICTVPPERLGNCVLPYCHSQFILCMMMMMMMMMTMMIEFYSDASPIVVCRPFSVTQSITKSWWSLMWVICGGSLI